jgi:hypothetical protein
LFVTLSAAEGLFTNKKGFPLLSLTQTSEIAAQTSNFVVRYSSVQHFFLFEF